MVDETSDERGRDTQLVILAAVAENGVIGSDGEIPWYYPEDLAHFKETTMGKPVIMGRRTYESIAERLDGPLPGRTNIVLSRSGFVPDDTGPDEDTSVRIAADIDTAIDVAAETGSNVAYVAGGTTVYEQFLPVADRMLITEVPETPAGDAYFPEWEQEAWTVRDRRRTEELAFVTYERAAPEDLNQGTS
ncbi:dihydrofolate reductase [Halorhabdus sp. CUG00001]|uniref:dihydrofolate reductase n=1 Tax=Halorhabdus sp. CUG00001 TaxID=2600297 RepID=UPI00131E1FBF